jgi:hypothetical protein
MDRCASYQSKSFEYLFPSPVIATTLCLSHDRTELFIISIIRLFIWILLFYIISELIYIDEYPIIKYTFYTMFGINILYIGIVVSKNPVFSVGSEISVLSYKEREGSVGSIPYSL